MAQGKTRDLDGMLVALVGGTGFFGTHLAQELLARGARLRVASRFPEHAMALKPLGNLGQVQLARCDVTKPESLARVLAGADAVVNLVGVFDGDLDAVMGQGAGAVAAAAQAAGASAFVQVSAIGADSEGPTGYARGSYRAKSWLVRIAGEVQSRAEMYDVQLAGCRRSLR
mgnify:CR=1 FL=1